MTSQPTALDFAAALAGRRSLRLHTGGNEYAATIPWPDAEPAGAFAVHLTDRAGRFRTVALDFDDARGDAVTDAARAAGLLTSVGISHITTVSGPTGGRHVLFTLQHRAHRDAVHRLAIAMRTRFGSLDSGPMISGTASAIRPPLAPHRISGRSELEVTAEEAIGILKNGNPLGRVGELLRALGAESWHVDLSLTPAPGAADLERRLSPQVLGLLQGTYSKPYGDSSPSGILRTLLIAMINARFTWGEVATVLEEHARASVIRRPGRGSWHDYLRAEYERAASWVISNPPATGPNDLRVELMAVSDVADAVCWKGQQGASELRVLQALLTIAIAVGRREINASVRQLGWMTTLTAKTVGRALVRLQLKGWIARMAVGSRGLASTYRLSAPAAASAEYHTKHLSGGACGGVVPAGQTLRSTQHDAFRRHSATWKCHGFLDLVEPVSAIDLAAHLDCHPSTVRTHLRKLSGWGLAARTPDGWIRIDHPLDDVALARGTSGMTDEQRDRARAESTSYRAGATRPVVDLTTGVISDAR